MALVTSQQTMNQFCTLKPEQQVWEVFRSQQEAIDFSETNGFGVKTFSFENYNGQRQFLCGHPERFWSHYIVREPRQRHTYEIITSNSMCKLYFDLEFHTFANGNHDGKRMTNTFIKVVSWFLQDTYSIHCDRKDVIDLDSSTKDKYSKHLIFVLTNAAFKDNIHVGNFVKMMCCKLRSMINDPKLMTVISEAIGVSTEDIKELQVQTLQGTTQLFCDEKVYTKNRHFRLFLSSKWQKNCPLELSKENEYKPIPNDLKCFFLDSLITFFRDKPSQTNILEYESPLGKTLGETAVTRNPVQSTASNNLEIIPRTPITGLKANARDTFLAWNNLLRKLGQPATWGNMAQDYRNALWSEQPDYQQRGKMATFAFLNSATHELDSYLQAKGVASHRITAIRKLYQHWCHKDPAVRWERRNASWAYHIEDGQFYTLNGELRIRNH